jgi:hypothetical protein
MELEVLKSYRKHKSLTVLTTFNDTETSSYCSHCHNSLSLVEYNKINRRNCICHRQRTVKIIKQTNMISKSLLIYVLISLLFCPYIFCLRSYQGSTASQVTTSRNSIDENKKIFFNEKDSYEDNIEESEEDDLVDQNEFKTSDIQKAYEKQFQAFPKNLNVKSELQNGQLTTSMPFTPRRTTGNAIPSPASACSSSVCLARKNLEEASTESIRKHILMKLGMEHEPNKTNYPKLPDELREILCKRMNINSEQCFGTKQTNIEYQSDEPFASQNGDYESGYDVVEEKDVPFMSYENRIYAFPSSK